MELNFKIIYPSEGGEVTEIISPEEAIAREMAIAAKSGHTYYLLQDVICNILCCPCTSRTLEVVGKTVVPYDG